MLTIERVSQLQDIVLMNDITDEKHIQLLDREEQLIVNGLNEQILKYAAGLNKLISERSK
ncbi:MAG: hypothetical protein IJZ96_00125 [Lachnospiraceae bacterium]|nr:hypothetical protein [Lachnospiraceae bacterium]MBQ8319026.1 hypothetical protein [Lachnospiraceae bacterium]